MDTGPLETRPQALTDTRSGELGPLLGGALVAVLLASLPLLLSNYQLSLATEILIFALLALRPSWMTRWTTTRSAS